MINFIKSGWKSLEQRRTLRCLTEQIDTNAIISLQVLQMQLKELLVKARSHRFWPTDIYLWRGWFGFQYGLAWRTRAISDIAYNCTGVQLVVDEVSINYLRGATSYLLLMNSIG